MPAAGPLSLESRRIEALLVDLDGTLTDPFDGITRSLREAAAAIGRPVPASDDLSWAIGPPLFENIRRVAPDADEATVTAGVAAYRARYGAVGKFENVVYPGIPEALAALNAAGLTLHLATSKLEAHAIEILEHFGLAGFFASAYGSQLDGSRANKAELIAHILSDRGLSADRLAMVGDRKHDCLGAAAHGIPTIGVEWGYGGRAELTAAGAAAIVATPAAWVALARSAAGL
ncbi:HAD hydrolase-like protein [Prosthecodimorpha staleyi]|uniref:HAD hydrolase-like protein n=1 Tax=Prosthecodimorpha staleyi TaxID=2840188 RepID=A0A947DAF6_9HYPH|nr:HAD hydrolase-like protein [Prosthecodimorpha staleyi]MBT9290129.1 HAD hydrolase-like protein [Prosthecodimorpha staleyi]